MEYKNLIVSWHLKASEEDYFSKFVFEYLAFIAYVKTQLHFDVGSDREAIQLLKQDEEIKVRYLNKIQTDVFLKDCWNKIKAEFDRSRLGDASRDPFNINEIKWWNCSYRFLDQMTIEETKIVKGVIHSLEDWENMVEFWYSIRNNLFHGTKDPNRIRDQFVVKYGYKTLRELMGMLLNE